MSKVLVNNTKSIFDAPTPQSITKKELVKKLKSIIADGGELSWFTTNKQSFEWAEVNENVKQFVEKLPSLDFNTVGIAVFYPRTKKTTYASFKIAN